MKIQKMMMFVAAATMLFAAACSKDDDKNTAAEATPNTLIIDGQTYHLNSGFYTDVNGRGYADATTTEQDGNNNPKYIVIADVEAETFNGTYSFPLPGSSYFFSIHNPDYTYECGLPLFNSGTLTITKNETLFEYKVDGQTQDGHKVSFWISVPASEWGNDNE